MVRLAILGTRGIPARYGGFETFAEQIASRLVERGISVTVFCEDSDADSPSSYRGVSLRYVRTPRLGPLTTVAFDFACLWHSRRGFDVVYMLGYGASVFCWIPRVFGAKVWINMDGLEWARSKWSMLARLWLRATEALAMVVPDRIIADAEGIRQNLADRYTRMPPCTMIPYGAEVVNETPDSSLLCEWGLVESSYYLVVCRFEPENHVLEIIKGYLASESGLPLIVVGDHKLPTSYVSALVELASDRVRFVGTVYDSEKLIALRYFCRAYFHGHSVGGTNPSLLEALGCGNPVIAHDNPFNREVAGDAAVYFKAAEDIPELVHSLERDEALLAKMAAESLGVVRQRYTWDHITDQYEALLGSETAQKES